jgi:prevent-host-death family protein
MVKIIGISKAREGLSDLINEVAFAGERYVVERRGKPLAALIGASEYQQITELLGKAGVSDEVCGIPVRIRFDGEQFFVNDDHLDLYGAGASLDEARSDYALAVHAYYADLQANAGRLARPLHEHLAYLRQVLGLDQA